MLPKNAIQQTKEVFAKEDMVVLGFDCSHMRAARKQCLLGFHRGEYENVPLGFVWEGDGALGAYYIYWE